MRINGMRAVALGALAASLSLLAMACGGSDGSRDFVPEGDTGGTTDGAGDGGGDSTPGDGGGDTGGGDGGGDTGGGDTGGDGGTDGGPTASGHTGKGTVSGGMTAESPKYRLITTTGQVPGYSNLSSAKYQLKGGVLGVTQP